MKVLVIGDTIIDDFYYGYIDRISPEAPIPIFKIESKKRKLGGAAHVAEVLVKWGCEVDFVSSVNGFARDLIEEANINTSFLELHSDDIHSIKNRYLTVDRNQLVFRTDNESVCRIEESRTKMIKDFYTFPESFNNYDFVIVSDYNKGFLDDKYLGMIIYNLSIQRRTKIVFDGKNPYLSSMFEFFENLDLWIPNKKEYNLFENNILGIARIDNLKVARKESENGISFLYGRHPLFGDVRNKVVNVPAIDDSISGVIGAGDVVTAAIPYYLKKKKKKWVKSSIIEAIKWANCAAHISCKKNITNCPSLKDIDSLHRKTY